MPRFLLFGSQEPLTEALAEALLESSACGLEMFTASPGELAEFLAGSPSPESGEVFSAAVYLAAARGEGDLPGPGDAQEVLRACADAGLNHLVVIASAAAYEPSHHHPGLADETRMPPLRRGGSRRRASAWRQFEAVIAEIAASQPEASLTLLRPPPVPVVGGRDPWSRLLAGRWAGAPVGRDPTVQLMAVSDLAAAASLAAASLEAESTRRSTVSPLPASPSAADSEMEGGGSLRVYNLAPAAAIPLTKALGLAGVRRLPLPASCLGWGGWSERDFVESLSHPWTVSGAKAALHLGFVPRLSSAQVALGLRRSGVAHLDRLVTLETPWGHLPPGELSSGEKPDPMAAPAAQARAGDWAGGGEPVPADWHRRFDEYGLDEGYVARLEKTLFRFLHDRYWRIEVVGKQHLPKRGNAVLVGIHRGLMPWDGVMALTAVRRATGRTPRFLIHPALNKFPFLSPYMTKLGGIHACHENADRILDAEGLLGVFPEGIRGAFSSYKDAYELKKFGRDEFVRMALRNRAPLVPFVTVGSAEIYPILAKLHWRWWKRLTEWPCLPITPTFPLLPVPLPSKWHTRFLAPLHIEREHGPEAAEDPRVVHEIGERVRSLMKRELDDMRQRRRSIFFGDIFPAETTKKRKVIA